MRNGLSSRLSSSGAGNPFDGFLARCGPRTHRTSSRFGWGWANSARRHDTQPPEKEKTTSSLFSDGGFLLIFVRLSTL